MDSLTKAFEGLKVGKKIKNSNQDRKMFGYYRCKDCNRHWQSANSWRDYGQKCQSCKKIVFAYRRDEFIKNEENKIDLKKPHPKHLCQKCKIYGDCTIRYSDYSNHNKKSSDSSSEENSSESSIYYYDDRD